MTKIFSEQMVAFVPQIRYNTISRGYTADVALVTFAGQ